MKWSPEALMAIAHRYARLIGARRDEVLPICRLRDHALIAMYVRGIGVVKWS